MDKEAQEKIATLLSGFFGRSMEYNMPQARVIVEELGQLGYRKLPKDKPPLIDVPDIPEGVFPLILVVILAAIEEQREADIKHYES